MYYENNTTHTKHAFDSSECQGELVHVEGHGCFFLSSGLCLLPDSGSSVQHMDITDAFIRDLIDAESTREERYHPPVDLFGLNQWNGKVYVFRCCLGDTALLEYNPDTQKTRIVMEGPEYDCTWRSRFMAVDGICYTATEEKLIAIDLSTGEMQTKPLPDMRCKPLPDSWRAQDIVDSSRTDWNYGHKYVGFFTDGDYGYVSLAADPFNTLYFPLQDPTDFYFLEPGHCSADVDSGEDAPAVSLVKARHPDLTVLDLIHTNKQVFLLSPQGLYRIPMEQFTCEDTGSFDEFFHPYNTHF